MDYYLIAGEASGDLHGSNLMRALTDRDPDATFRCWGGDLMQQAGGELVKHYRDLAFMGFWEVLVNLPAIARNLAHCKRDILKTNPHLLILIDYPGFNLRIARFANRHGIRVFYYISPQLWAWKSSRVRIIRDCVERMFVILPFEKDFYAQHGIRVDFVGHPLLDVIPDDPAIRGSQEFLDRNNLPDKPIIALLPGSRKQEIRHMLGRMMEVVSAFGDYQFVIAGAPSLEAGLYDEATGTAHIPVVFGQTYDLLRHSCAALVTSGTATLETALLGIPEVVCYRGSPLSFWIARRIVHVPFISLVNLIMGEEVVKELIQHQVSRENLIRELRMLLDKENRARMQERFAALRQKLGSAGGASAATAERMIQYLQDN